jgi:hypothetical protein
MFMCTLSLIVEGTGDILDNYKSCWWRIHEKIRNIVWLRLVALIICKETFLEHFIDLGL